MNEHASLEQLAAFLDEPEEAPVAVVAHVEGCELCARYLTLMRNTESRLQAMPNLPAPAGEWDRVVARLEEQGVIEPSGKRARWLGRFRERLAFDLSLPRLAVAAGTLVLVFVGGFLTGTLDRGTDVPTGAFGPGPELAPIGPGDQGVVAGARLQPLGPELAWYFEGADGGLLVLEVSEGSLFHDVGLRAGDVLVRAGDTSLGDVEEFRTLLLRALGEPEAVGLEWVRRGEPMRAELE